MTPGNFDESAPTRGETQAVPISDVDGTLVAIDAAERMVTALCQPKGHRGAREWVMSIPANPESDPDLVIGEALHAARKTIYALREQQRETQAPAAALVDENVALRDEARSGTPSLDPGPQVSPLLGVRRADGSGRGADRRDSLANHPGSLASRTGLSGQPHELVVEESGDVAAGSHDRSGSHAPYPHAAKRSTAVHAAPVGEDA